MSLSQSIFRLIASLIVLVFVTILGNVLVTTSEHTRQQLTGELDVAQNILNEVLKSREELLYNAASVLTADFGFKQAVATKDRNTINSALKNHGDRISADLMSLISFENQVMASIPVALSTHRTFLHPELVKRVVEDGGISTLLMLDERLYQVILLTVDAPAPIAVALIGFQLDRDLIGQLKKITQLETTIQVFSEDREIFLVSSLTERQQFDALSEQAQGLSWLSLTPFSDLTFVSRRFVLTDQLGFQVVATLSDDMTSLLTRFSRLQLNILMIAIAAIALAMFAAAILSRKMIMPLTALAELAQNISNGNYRQVIDSKSSTKELNHLSSAFSAMQTGIRQREEEIVYRARHDALTDLVSRSYAGTLLETRFSRCEEFQAIGINIFGFRRINDVFGYSTGDSCLKELADRVKLLGGMAARLTGGELLWVPPSPLSLSEIERIKHRLEAVVHVDDAQIEFDVAIALLNCPADASSAQEMFRRMNVTLDEAQITGRLVLAYEDELEQRYLRRLTIVTELKKALTERPQELSLFYQPKLEIATGRIHTAEALIRWNSERLGFVSPEDFIVIAEHAGLIEAVTDWVLSRSVTDALALREIEPRLTVAINLSGSDVVNPHLLSKVTSLLEDNNLPSDAISFEVTESELVKDVDKAIKHLAEFREKKFSIAIDDFGTGYSSMTYLKQLPVTSLKVDKSFVMKLCSEKDDQSIVKMVIGLAHSFGLSVIAEGVEDKSSLALLREWNCEFAQGYYLAKPMPVIELSQWLLENRNTQW